MKKTIKAILILLFATATMTSMAQKHFELKNPAGTITVDIYLERSNIEYSVKHGEDMMLERSPLSMRLSDGAKWGVEPQLKKSSQRSVSAVIKPPLYRKAQIEDKFNELAMEFRGNYDIIFRAYDDGVAYRFVSKLSKPFTVESEQVEFNFAGDPMAYVAWPKGRMNEGKEDLFYSSFQNTYTHFKLSEWTNEKIAFLPILVEGVNGKKICITEADLINYPGMYLNNNLTEKSLQGVFAAYPKEVKQEVKGLKGVVKSREPYIAKVDGRVSFPWRVVIISEKDTDLLDNDMVYKLATPAKTDDFSWVKPGKVAWDWWNNWNIYGVDFESGINNDTYKYYIDFASSIGLEYVILDEGWSVQDQADLFQVVPEIDLKYLIEYATSKNVGLILWAGYYAFDRDMDAICRHYSQMGIKGFKIDFMDRDDQYMINFNYRAAEAGAKHKMLINLHGTSKPTGLQRTFPNSINFEGVHGLEELKWAKPEIDQVTYDVVMPFIRMVAGPIDYTQGAMNNANKENFRTVYTEPISQGTRCRQLAEYVIFESPLNMLCDSPTNYINELEYTKFVAAIPTVWDETVALKGEVSECIAIARRSGNTWYVGALTNWTARDMEIDLSFLGNGGFDAELFRDGANADKVAKDYKREKITLPTDKKITLHMASGGGFMMKIDKSK